MNDWYEYLSNNAYIKAFVKGPPGSGKTYLAAGVTKICKTLFIDVEGGVISSYPVVHYQNFTLRMIREPDSKSFFQRIQDVMNEAMSGQYDAVVLDSLTEVVGRMEDEYSVNSKSGKLEFGDWYVLIERVKRFSRLLRDLPCHTIVTSLTKPTGKEDGTSIFEPVLPGQSCSVVPSFFDIVGLLRRGAGKSAAEYFLATDGPTVYQVRDRTHTLAGEERIEQTDTSRIWRKVVDGLRKLAEANKPPTTTAAAPVGS